MLVNDEYSVGLANMSSTRVYYSAPCCQLSYLPENIFLDSPDRNYDNIQQCVKVATQHTNFCDYGVSDFVEDTKKSLEDVITPKNSASDLLIKKESEDFQKLVVNPPTSAIIISSSESNKSLHFKDFIVKPKTCNVNLDAIGTFNTSDDTLYKNETTDFSVASPTYVVGNRSTIYRMQVPLAQRLLATPPELYSYVEAACSTSTADESANHNCGNEKRKLSNAMDNKPVEFVKKLTTDEAKVKNTAKDNILTGGMGNAVKSYGIRKNTSSINFNKIHKQMQFFIQ